METNTTTVNENSFLNHSADPMAGSSLDGNLFLMQYLLSNLIASGAFPKSYSMRTEKIIANSDYLCQSIEYNTALYGCDIKISGDFCRHRTRIEDWYIDMFVKINLLGANLVSQQIRLDNNKSRVEFDLNIGVAYANVYFEVKYYTLFVGGYVRTPLNSNNFYTKVISLRQPEPLTYKTLNECNIGCPLGCKFKPRACFPVNNNFLCYCA